MKSVVSKPPEQNQVYFAADRDQKAVFLAGSIEMGAAEEWQDRVVSACPTGVTFLNPRRDDWDSSWEQSIENEQFRGQVEWELENIRASDIVFFYFDPNTKSPISLLELGIVLASKIPAVVCCAKGFWRKGNVDVTCANYNVYVHEFMDLAILDLKEKLRSPV